MQSTRIFPGFPDGYEFPAEPVETQPEPGGVGGDMECHFSADGDTFTPEISFNHAAHARQPPCGRQRRRQPAIPSAVFGHGGWGGTPGPPFRVGRIRKRHGVSGKKRSLPPIGEGLA
ncbi:hypothetical protein GCM10010433_22970 [Streptomyces pulveraceus]